MNVRISDAVFRRDGSPTVVKDQDEVSGQLHLKSDPKEIRQDIRHGYINGLSGEGRESFNEIMDEVKELKDPKERTLELKKRLTELEEDPRNHVLATYVRAEMLHLMNTYNIRPTEYTADADRVG